MRTLIIVAAASVVFNAGAGTVLTQSTPAPPVVRRFEVASVKPTLSLRERKGTLYWFQIQPGGRFRAGPLRLTTLIAEAFDVRDFQIEGGPKWLATDYFDITANAGADATPTDVKAMLRTLLIERFSLRTHSDTRQAPVYVLTVARGDGRLGPRLTRSTPECIQWLEQRKNGSAPATPRTASEIEREQELILRMNRGDAELAARCGTSTTGGRANGVSTLTFSGFELTSLVWQLSSELSTPVIDRTELTGLFDVALEYLSERSINGRAPGLDPNGTDVPPLTLVPVLQQQLGLKLEKQIGPMPVVVIEAAAHPTPD